MAVSPLTIPDRANQLGWTRIMELQDGLLLLKPELKRKSKAFNDVAVDATAMMRQIWLAAQHADIRTDFLKEVTATRGTTLMAKLVRYLLRLTKEEIGSDIDLQRKQTQMAYALDYMETNWKTDRDPSKPEIIKWIEREGGLGLIQMKWLDHMKKLDAEQAERDRQAEEERLAFQEYQARQRLERDATALGISPEELVERREREAEAQASAQLNETLATVQRRLAANGIQVEGESVAEAVFEDNAIYQYKDGRFVKLSLTTEAIYIFNGTLIMVRDLDRLDLLACKAGVLAEMND